MAKDLINGYSILNDAKYFAEDGSQNYFIFQPLIKYFKLITNNLVMLWNSKGLPDENFKLPATSDNSLNPRLDYFNNTKFQVEFNESFFKTETADTALIKR